MSNKRISKRIYPSTECRQCKRPFNPSDARQLFCSAQHRIDYNNDQRKIKSAPLDLLNKELWKNERILKKIFESLKQNKQESFGIDLLKYEGYNFNVSRLVNINKTSQNKIYWSLSYGMEIDDENKKTFKIHKADR